MKPPRTPASERSRSKSSKPDFEKSRTGKPRSGKAQMGRPNKITKGHSFRKNPAAATAVGQPSAIKSSAKPAKKGKSGAVSYTHLRAHETGRKSRMPSSA